MENKDYIPYAICFTKNGFEKAYKLDFPKNNIAKGFGEDKINAKVWCQERFKENEVHHVLIVFVGAVGIAVRMIAPFIKNKIKDPAVICFDESYKYCIPLLSGHIGMANEIALELSKKIGSVPVVTTATDINNLFAIDVWARKNKVDIVNPSAIKNISSAILERKKVAVSVDIKDYKNSYAMKLLTNDFVEDNDISSSYFSARIFISVFRNNIMKAMEYKQILCLVPKIIYIGIGCKKNTDFINIKESIEACLRTLDIDIRAVNSISSIDIKKNEAGIIKYAESIKVPFRVYSKEELNSLSGDYSSSSFVSKTVGVDCVCERACNYSASIDNIDSCNIMFLKRKTIYKGVTVAVAKAIK